MKLIGRVHNVFYLAENELGLVIIDQHAAHERVLYEKFMQQFYNGTIHSQELLVAEEIEFSPTEMLLFKEHRKSIEQLGFMLEEFGRNTLLLRSVPSILGKLVDKETVHEILAQITDRTTLVHEKKEEKIIRTACRAAVKANDVVHLNEMHGIMQQLQVCKQPFTCPHGRPTMIQFTIPELERKFKRVV
jgi:DNA mismatch repair protein MutL